MASYLSLPGEAGDYASAPDSAALSVTGDIDIRARVALDDWTPAALTMVVVKWLGAGNQRSFLFGVNTNNKLWWQHSENGSANKGTQTSDTTPAYSDGTLQWIRVTLDVDDGAADGTVSFYEGGTGDTPSWGSLGTDKVGSTTSIFDSTADLAVGMASDATTGPLAGKVYRVIVYSDLTETTQVFDSDFTAEQPGTTSFTESSPQAATVTINQSGDPQAEIIEDPGDPWPGMTVGGLALMGVGI